MAAFLKDRRGAVAIQVVLLLPILIIIIIGAYEVWKVLYVRQTLNDAAYQSARLLALQPYYAVDLDRDGDEDWGPSNELAENLVRRYVGTNRFIDLDNPDDPDEINVSVTMPDLPVCGEEVIVDVTLEWVIGKDLGRHNWIPFLGRPHQMAVRATGPIIGGQRVWP